MSNTDQFYKPYKSGYSFKGEHVKIRCAMLDSQVLSGADVLFR